MAVGRRALIEAGRELLETGSAAEVLLIGVPLAVTQSSTAMTDLSEIDFVVLQLHSGITAAILFNKFHHDVPQAPNGCNFDPSWSWSTKLAEKLNGRGQIRLQRKPNMNSKHDEGETRMQFLLYQCTSMLELEFPIVAVQESSDSDNITLALFYHCMNSACLPLNTFVKGQGKYYYIC